MVSKPDYDPNSLVDNYQDIISDENSKVLLNQSTQGLFVPGSIFKIVTSLAYLRSGGDPDNYSYYCDGSISLNSDDGDSYIKCYGGEEHGQVDLLESFAESCNASFRNLSITLTTFIKSQFELLGYNI
jgi:peptidoglycan glycosyltransferase